MTIMTTTKKISVFNHFRVLVESVYKWTSWTPAIVLTGNLTENLQVYY